MSERNEADLRLKALEENVRWLRENWNDASTIERAKCVGVMLGDVRALQRMLGD